MAVTEGNLPIGGTTKELATTVVKQADGSFVHREEVVVADPETTAARANVKQFKDEYQLKTRGAEDEEILIVLHEIRDSLKVMTRHLEAITDLQFTTGEARNA